MSTQTPPPADDDNSARINWVISLVFHVVVLGLLGFFAAREGLLGDALKKITVEMVHEKPPEKPREPEKPKPEPPPLEAPKVAAAPRPEPPREPALAPKPAGTAAVAPPPVIAPPQADVPAFEFDGGKSVQTSSDPVQLYRGYLEAALRANWNRPPDLADDNFVVEVEISVDRAGLLANPAWKKASGSDRWDESVRRAIAATKSLERPPPASFPARVLVRFDVQETAEPQIQ